MLPHRSVSGRAPIPPMLCRPRQASDNRVPDGAGRCCTTKQHNAHVTEEREVFYPWHPWFGHVVHVHEIVGRDGVTLFRCGVTENRTGRCLDVPSWMFDRAACLHLRRADAPQVDRAALERLRTLMSGAAGRAPSAHSMVGARHPIPVTRGDADVAQEPSGPDRSARPVPSALPGARSGQPAEGRTADGGTPDGADAGGGGKRRRPQPGGRARR